MTDDYVCCWHQGFYTPNPSSRRSVWYNLVNDDLRNLIIHTVTEHNMTDGYDNEIVTGSPVEHVAWLQLLGLLSWYLCTSVKSLHPKYEICPTFEWLAMTKSMWASSFMMTSSNRNIFRVTGPLCGEFIGHRWIPRTVTRSFDIFFDQRLNKRLSKSSLGWWFETPLRPLWRH